MGADDDYIFGGFTAYHLAWMDNHDLLGGGIRELGALVDLPEAAGVIEDYLRNTEAIIDAEGRLTDAGHAIFDPLTRYRQAWWGVVLITGWTRPLTVDLDDELIDAGIDLALTDTPRVYVKITDDGDRLTTAVRAGDGVTITSSPLAGRGVNAAVADAVLSVVDPQRAWKPAPIAVTSTSLEAAVDPSAAAGKAADRLRTIAAAPTQAALQLVRSTTDANVSTNPITVRFITDGTALVHSARTGVDRITRSVYAPLTADSLAEAIGDLSAIPLRDRIDHAR